MAKWADGGRDKRGQQTKQTTTSTAVPRALAVPSANRGKKKDRQGLASFFSGQKKEIGCLLGSGVFVIRRRWPTKKKGSDLRRLLFLVRHTSLSSPSQQLPVRISHVPLMPSSLSIEIDPMSAGPRGRSRSASLPLPIRRDSTTAVATVSLAMHGTDRTARGQVARPTATTMTATIFAGRARRKRTKAFLLRGPGAASRAVADALYS
ncbi:hypothetical protein [Pandoravirus japonicus]|uniref:Uncharacterized protein n=1 Tax=Pandoravirus japonicus TaxID=2823154 RepID=A0A811BTX3_9VIRU|nr:hypothetical protein [Pandoravirus japonicus]